MRALATHLNLVADVGDAAITGHCCWRTGGEWWAVDVVRGTAYTYCYALANGEPRPLMRIEVPR